MTSIIVGSYCMFFNLVFRALLNNLLKWTCPLPLPERLLPLGSSSAGGNDGLGFLGVVADGGWAFFLLHHLLDKLRFSRRLLPAHFRRSADVVEIAQGLVSRVVQRPQITVRRVN